MSQQRCRQQTLNNAIVLRQPHMPPIIKKFMVASKFGERVKKVLLADD